ncbi:transposase [Aminobacter sp. AP02]|uniref:transposase n=1 Tax=Aminobacter sp. AP02 TaxID=2135737 RepID=UPI001FDED53A|nr:transposase [Aminobacter sp. AP02]
MTDPPKDSPAASSQPARRLFSDDDKRAIALETKQPDATVSRVARKHGIVTGIVFRWRAEFGVTQK